MINVKLFLKESGRLDYDNNKAKAYELVAVDKSGQEYPIDTHYKGSGWVFLSAYKKGDEEGEVKSLAI